MKRKLREQKHYQEMYILIKKLFPISFNEKLNLVENCKLIPFLNAITRDSNRIKPLCYALSSNMDKVSNII